MIIPTCRGMSQLQDDEDNQSITRQPMKSSDKDDTMIFYRGSFACRQASPHCGDSLTWRFTC
jgi:hypothetical protein